MEKTRQKKLQPNDREKANILSLLTFWWMGALFKKGSKKALEEEDMMELSESDSSEIITENLEKNWKKELEKLKTGGKPSLTNAIVRTHGLFFAKIGIITAVEETLRVISPLLVAKLIRYFETIETTPVSEAYILATGISLISLGLTIAHHLMFYYVLRMGWHLRVAACALMFKKTLRLSQKALGQTTTGQIVNLGSTDVLRFDFLPIFIHYIWAGPIQAIVCGYLLWDTVGPAVLAGLGVLFLIMVIQSLNGRLFGKLRMQTAIITDERIRLMNEVIAGMRIIKMYTWEKPFANLVAEIRKKEVRKIMSTALLRAFNLSMFTCSPKVISCITFVVYVLSGGELVASQVFKVIGMFNVIRLTLGLFFPTAIEKMAEAKISIKRIQTFLLHDEFQSVEGTSETNTNLDKEINGKVSRSVGIKESFVEMKNFCGTWSLNNEGDGRASPSLTLKNINVRVEAGQLLAVIGPVGSGKSSFLSAVLGELPTSSGEIVVNGKVTFANQVPWVFAGTVQDNILFGEDYDASWYSRVTKACGLERDFELLPQGDRTLVGDRGVTLSGGQKARVNLARAAYRKEATVCLLDDPLSAVDAAVSSHLFKHCISGLMKNKVRILVTHQLQLLQDADQIIILKEGEVVGHGTYSELQADGTDFAELLKEREEEEEDVLSTKGFSEADDELTVLIKSPKSPRLKRAHHTTSVQSVRSLLSEETKSLLGDEQVDLDYPEVFQEEEFTPAPPDEEEKAQGGVGGRVYWKYFSDGAGKLFLVLFLLVILGSHVAFLLTEWWISVWASNYVLYQKQLASSTLPFTVNSTVSYTANSTFMAANYSTVPNYVDTTIPVLPFNTSYYLKIYAGLTGAALLLIVLRAMMHFYVCVSSGIRMHNQMFQAILRAPVRFFDTNPSGRILNRFSKDIGQIDDLLPVTFFDFLFICGLIFSILILSIAINYLVAIIVLPMVAYFFWLRQYYIKTSRDIKRMEGSTRSPVFSLLSSTLQGIMTVRALKVQKQFEKIFHERQDLHSSAWYLFICAGRWIGVRLDLLSSLFITTIAFISLLTLPIIPISPGLIGLTLTYAILLLGMFQWGVRQSAEVENLMTSVERVQQYSSIPPEAPAEIPDKKPPSDWPRYGVVSFDQVSFAYYNGGPEVLKKIRLNIRAQEKVGIVGRTGAGKSSLISALFRLSELSGGEILIDGIPISPLGLDDLRNSLSIIPQDPILFTGTMRRNLDPFSQYNDTELWNALKQVQLKDVVDNLPSKLDTELAESGSNFSVGQRQLVCLARAVLRKCKILVIDEATANVDLRTDRLIQLTIREKFQFCTVLTIAHRINTIIDSDRVLVLDAGRVQEFEDPHLLLQDSESFFSQMIANLSPGEADLLRKMAEEAYKARNEPKVTLPEDFKDSDRSHLSRFAPIPGSFDHIEYETGV